MCLCVSATRFELFGANPKLSQLPFGSIYSVLGTEESEMNTPPCGALRTIPKLFLLRVISMGHREREKVPGLGIIREVLGK